ncbi:MAG: GTPase HflX [Lachnospiraceae bacterium]|nr:GTPase HflX [Lachnospiraceae bacterium]
MQDDRETVILVGVDTGEEREFDRSMMELKALAEACELRVAGILTQRMPHVNPVSYIGSGKVQELRDYAQTEAVDKIVFDDSLSPSQIRNLTNALERPILDRTNLILDIFAIRARTNEAKMQVEMARLQYMLPRLVGAHASLGRQGGTGGSMSNKGSGEKQLELDRRRIEQRLARLRKELAVLEKSRQTQRKRRNTSDIPQVALVGYTNAGKSTILNRMMEGSGRPGNKQVFEKDMLFATLETSVRRVDVGDGRPFLLSDTVGFIHKLPHGLIKAFRSTLDEVRYADLLVQVVDISDEDYRMQMEVTADTLKELEIGDIPQLIVYNKADKQNMESLPRVAQNGNSIHMAAGKGIGMDVLRCMIQDRLYGPEVEDVF